MFNQNNLLLTSILILISGVNLNASTPKTKTYKNQQDFQNGETKGISINHRGEVSLAPKITEVYAAPVSFIWASVLDSRGNLYISGGDNGEIYQIDKQGNGTLFFQAEEPQIYALAIDAQDNIYAGSSPNGKIYKLTPKRGSNAESVVHFNPEQLYIWDLAVNRSGDLFVATGEGGKIFKVSNSGIGSVFYESDDQHIVRLCVRRNNSLLAGTSQKGIVLQLDPSGQAFVLFDSPLTEITDIYEQDGFIYAAATGSSNFPRGQSRMADAPSQAHEGDTEGVDEENGLDLPPQPATVPGVANLQETGELYQIHAGGAVRTLQTLRSERIYCMAATSNQHLLLGTGKKGRLYAMESNGNSTLLAGISETRITAFVEDPGSGTLFLCTSNGAKVYKVERNLEDTGEFISEVYDADVVSQWGAITWEPSGSNSSGVTLQTRSGNTTEPDKTWSEWSKSYQLNSGSKINSPAARYLQVKATFVKGSGSSSPLLHEISFSHLQKNLPPVIKLVYVLEPGEYYPEALEKNSRNHLSNGKNRSGNDFQNQSLGRKSYQKGFRSVSWIAEDQNGDKLSYDIFYRATDDRNWKELTSEYSGVVYSWDSELMPDGKYEIKLLAKDELSNPPAMVLNSEKLSEAFVVDNSGPVVTDLRIQTNSSSTIITFAVSDALSNIESVEYSINTDDWKLVYPVDDISDSRQEQFEITVNGQLEKGSSIAIKAHDAIQNIGFGKKRL